jgi:hypothetical protein
MDEPDLRARARTPRRFYGSGFLTVQGPWKGAAGGVRNRSVGVRGWARLLGLEKTVVEARSRFARARSTSRSVVDHRSGRLVWASFGRDRKTVEKFLELLGEQRYQQIGLVSCDDADWITRPTSAHRRQSGSACAMPSAVRAMATASAQVGRDRCRSDSRVEGVPCAHGALVHTAGRSGASGECRPLGSRRCSQRLRGRPSSRHE